MRRVIVRRAVLLFCTIALCAGAGCAQKALLWADTATTQGDGFSQDSPQWAYAGEPVNFDFWPKGGTDYVVFECGGDAEVMLESPPEGFRWTRTFKAGPEPKDYVVWATAYLRRGRTDWICDKDTEEWYLYPGIRDRPDKVLGEKRMTIRCYQVLLEVPFKAPKGRPKSVVVALIKEDGARVQIPQRTSPLDDKRGFLLIGPDENKTYEVIYTPTYKEVSRAGYTTVEVIVEHSDGTITRIERRGRTP